MTKRAISVTLNRDNLTWLKARTAAVGARSVSDLIDQLIGEARRASPGGTVRSVVGTIDIDRADPLLQGADDVLRTIVEGALRRPTVGKESRARSGVISKTKQSRNNRKNRRSTGRG